MSKLSEQVEATMLQSVLGTKIGMTQVFNDKGEVIPVTVVNVAHWFVTQVKTQATDGYTGLQLGLLKKKYRVEEFSLEWLKKKQQYFLHVKEVAVSEADIAQYQLGQSVSFDSISLNEGGIVSITARSRGLGFQGCVKRWGFAGGPKTHGSTFHRRPGSLGNMRSQGEVLKGKRLPGRAGYRNFTVRGMTVVRVDQAEGCLWIKGALPGKKDALVVIKKQKV